MLVVGANRSLLSHWRVSIDRLAKPTRQPTMPRQAKEKGNFLLHKYCHGRRALRRPKVRNLLGIGHARHVPRTYRLLDKVVDIARGHDRRRVGVGLHGSVCPAHEDEAVVGAARCPRPARRIQAAARAREGELFLCFLILLKRIFS